MDDIKRQSIKVTLLGDSAVGKTSICNSFLDIDFDSPLPIDSGKMNTKMKLESGEVIKVNVWDTAGQERYKSISLSIAKRSQGILIIFDLTHRRSFDNVFDWIESINETTKVAIVLVGNKFDSENRVVSKEEAEKLAKEYNLPYFESSAKLGINIKEAFSKVVNDAYKKFSSENVIDLKDKKIEKKERVGCFGLKKRKKEKI